MAGIEVVGGLDKWQLATETFQLNFPRSEVFNSSAEDVRPSQIAKKVGKIDILLASPECTSHSVAKGNAPGCEVSRETAFQVVRFAKALQPRWMVVENVGQMKRWHRFEEWLRNIQELGYKTCVTVLDSSDFRTPQSRRRLFILCDREKEPTPPSKLSGPKCTVGAILGKGRPRSEKWKFRLLDKNVHAAATHKRANNAISAFGKNAEFILVYYGSDGAGGYQAIDRPLRTITTLDRFAYVRPTKSGHEMRMLQPPELAAAMGFPPDHAWADSSRRERIKFIGNAVCPRVMCAIISHLTGNMC